MRIGDAATAQKERQSEPVSLEERQERAIETACAKPAKRDLKANKLYRECVVELRNDLARLEQAPVVIASRD